MKYLLGFTLFLLLLASCSSDDDNQARKETFVYTFTENSRIATDAIVNGDNEEVIVASVEPGDSLVFKYQYSLEADPNIADSGFGERIMFQVDPQATSFTYADIQLTENKTFYEAFCFCQFDGDLPISSGDIQGTKLENGTWDIDIEIRIEYEVNTVTKEASGIFKLE